MRFILILLFLCSSWLKLKSQTADSKIICQKVIAAVTGKYRWRRDTILIYDSTMNWRAKGDYLLLSMMRKRTKSSGDEWGSVLQNFDLCPQPTAIKNYFELRDVPKIAGAKFRYASEKPSGTDLFGYWRISFAPLYFNEDSTKCVAVAEFLVGKCGNGANRILYFQKNKEGLWIDAKPFFIN